MEEFITFDDCKIRLADISMMRRRDYDLYNKPEKLSALILCIKGLTNSLVFCTTSERMNKFLGDWPNTNFSLLNKMTSIYTCHHDLHVKLIAIFGKVIDYKDVGYIFDFDALIPIFLEELMSDDKYNKFVEGQSKMLTIDKFRQKIKEYADAIATSKEASDKRDSWKNEYLDIFLNPEEQKFLMSHESLLNAQIKKVIDKIEKSKSEEQEEQEELQGLAYLRDHFFTESLYELTRRQGSSEVERSADGDERTEEQQDEVQSLLRRRKT